MVGASLDRLADLLADEVISTVTELKEQDVFCTHTDGVLCKADKDNGVVWPDTSEDPCLTKQNSDGNLSCTNRLA